MDILQLRKDNERMQTALQDAINARLAKEGEVTVLRKNMEKVRPLPWVHIRSQQSDHTH